METFDGCKVVNKRSVFVSNFKSYDDPHSDLTLIKEKIKLEDGREVPNLRMERDLTRPFWVENKHTSVYKDKKETRSLQDVQEFWCTQAELRSKVAKVTGQKHGGIRKLARSPYLYGLDCDVTVHYKRLTDKENLDAYGDYVPILSMAVLDYETNMFSDEGEIIMGAVTMKDKWLCAVDRNWLSSRRKDGEEKILEYLERYLGESAKSRGVNLKEAVVFVDSEIDVVKVLFERLHELSPDVCSIWNVAFDIDKTLDACRRAGVDPSDVFCDPSVPLEFRPQVYNEFVWRKDEDVKQKAGGKSSTKDISDRWHWLSVPCSFQFIDNMCAYRMFRAMEQKAPSYKLDAVLYATFKGDVKKMKFDHLEDIPDDTGAWHKEMQSRYPLEYICYNIFDCVSMELLDEKIKDISHKLYTYVGISNWKKAKSNPTRLADAYHFFLLEKHGRVLCSTSDNMRHPFDGLTIPKTNWIITLDNTLIDTTELGYNPFNRHIVNALPEDADYSEKVKAAEFQDIMYSVNTKLSVLAFDIDVSSGYPSNEIACNVSRDTTLVEVCQVETLTLDELREVGTDLMNSRGNGSKICRMALNFPSFDELEKEFLAQA